MKILCKTVRVGGAATLLAAISLSTPALTAQQPASITTLRSQFQTPPADARPLMRWWWFGPAVTKPELQREILAMKAGGIGGFEIQPVYPMALDDTSKNFKNLPYLSDAFLDAVRFANTTAHANGMRVDMTLASGWPYGGAYVPADHAAAHIRVAAVDVPAKSSSLELPALSNGETLLATFLGEGSARSYDPNDLRPTEVESANGRMTLAAGKKERVVVFYIESRTGQQVKRAAVGAEGFVLDHFSHEAVQDHLNIVGNRLMTAFGNQPPYSVFSDSLEVYGADWTNNMLAEFQRRRGYDLKPLLPELLSGTDEKAFELRHDWGVTLTELMGDSYLTPIDTWAKAHHTLFRSQTYGEPAVSLSSNRLVALPEGEGPQWDRFSFTRWATSASHLYGRNVTSAETWTWLHSPAFRATPLDMKAEADRFFLEGVNQLVGHGWPYTPPGTAEPGWSFYAAAVFNDHNPWWLVMPDVTRYLQRTSFLLRQGQPANDIAILLPNDDAYAQFIPSHVSLSALMPKFITPELMQQVLGAGHNVDYIDAEAIEHVGIHYPVLILPHVERLSPATLKAIAAYAAHGGKVIAIGTTPDRAPGFVNAAAVTDEVRSLSKALFAGPNAQVLADESTLGATLQAATTPDLKLSSGANDVGFLHRKLPSADVYFVANTANHAVDATANFRSQRAYASAWNLEDGSIVSLEAGAIALHLAPYGSTAIVFTDKPVAEAKPSQLPAAEGAKTIDLSHDWMIRFAAQPQHKVASLSSWTDDSATRYFSGVATYTKTIHVSAEDLSAKAITLDFGEGTPLEPQQREHGTMALLDAPVRDAAVVIVNGKRVGSLWHPPYALDIKASLHAGENQLEIQVANTAINLLAGKAAPNYKLLNGRYGERFVPQDTENLQPLPSGILGQVRLIETK